MPHATEAARRKAEGIIQEWRARLDLLQAKAAQAGGDLELSVRADLAAAERTIDGIRTEIDRTASEAGDEAERLEQRLAAASDELDAGLHRAADRIGGRRG